MGKFKKPENISALSAEDLKKAIEEAVAAFKPFNEKEIADLTDEEVEEMDAISAFLVEADQDNQRREGEAQERAQRVQAAKDAVAKASKPAEDSVPTEGEEEDGEDGERQTSDGDDDPDEVQEPTGNKIPEAVAASGKPTPKKPLSKRIKDTKDEVVDEPGFTLVAAAGARNVPMGTAFESLTAAGSVIMDSLNALPATAADGSFIKSPALQLKSPKHRLSQANFQGRDTELLLLASREQRLDGGNLVAAGGWGAISNRVDDWCPLEIPTGLVDIPEVTITRGGVTYTRGPSFEDVMNSNTGFWDMTEATAEAGTELKTSLRPAIPAYQEKRLDAVGVMVEAGLLLQTGWPELVDSYAQMALAAHQLKVSAKVLAGIRSYTGAPISMNGVGLGNALDVLHILDLVAAGERQRHAMSDNATLEVLLPVWVRNIIRVDLANRHGVDAISVSDQQINGFFTARNLRVQWLNLYQEIDVDTRGVASEYPEIVEAIMYPAGTYVKGVADVITLDTVYDSVNLKKNDFVKLFVEQGVMVTNPCGTGRRISFPLYANGRSGAADITANFGGYVAPAV